MLTSFNMSIAGRLEGVSFTLTRGTHLLLGRNGSGKSTLLKALAGLIPFKEGTLFWDEINLTALNPKERAKILTWVPFQPMPPFAFSVLEYLKMGLHGLLEPDINTLMELLESFEVDHLAKRKVPELSSGERQLIQIARALLRPAPLLLLDEPTAHLDWVHQKLVWQRLFDEGKSRTLLIATHDRIENDFSQSDLSQWLLENRTLRKKSTELPSPYLKE